MGTFVTVTAVSISVAQTEQAIGSAFEEMDRLIAIFNRHDAATPLSLLNRDSAITAPPPELVAVINHAKQFNLLTHGAFDPTVKPLLDLFDEGFSQSVEPPPSSAEIQKSLEFMGIDGIACSPRRISLSRPGMGLTLDGIAKGFIVDRISQVLVDCGVVNHLVSADGDIRTSGSTSSGRPWTIALEDPKKNRDYPEIIRLHNGAIATSGN